MENEQKRPARSGLQSRRKKIYGLVGAAALAAAVTFGGNTLIPAISTAQAQTATVTPSTGSGTVAPTTGDAQQGMKPMDGRGGPGKGPGRGPDAARNGASGTISAISGNTITLKQGDVVVIQATVNSSTTYTKAGKTISLSDLKVGQKASVRTTTASDGTVTVSAVDVLLDHAGGTISSVDSSSLTITKSDNSTVKVALSSSTSYQDLGKAISLSDLKAGVRVEVAGELNSDGTLSAEVVNVQHDRLGGTITAINGNTVTVQVDGRGPGGPGGRGPGAPAGNNGNGNSNGTNGTTTPGTGSTSATPATTTKTITLSDSTVYQEAGQTVQVSELALGERIDAVGTLSSDKNSLTALQVVIQLPHYQGQVTSVNGSTIVIQDRSGSRTIEVNSSTKYLNGQASASLSDVKAGVQISAEGKVDSSGKMTASVIQLGQPTGPNGGPGNGRGH